MPDIPVIPEAVKNYVTDPAYRRALGLPQEVAESYALLAQGEYNVNYIFAHPVTGRKLLLRVNMGSQMHLDSQIEYEAHALRLLSGCGRTPGVLYSDGSRRCGNRGILVMEYLPGECPHYTDRAEMDAVMECLADIHAVPVPADEVLFGEPEAVPRDTVRLIAPADPADAILDECEAMVKTYMDSPLGDDSVKKRLRRLLDRGHELANAGRDEAGGAGAQKHGLYRCCINTELNSTNFLVERRPAGTNGIGKFGTDKCAAGKYGTDKSENGGAELFARLVDWEKPLYADPAQDLGHLLAPTTTFWKTDDILSREETERLIEKYIEAAGDRFDTCGIGSRTRRLINITCLRGLTWCAMAWVQYRDPRKAIANESTRVKLDAYLSDSFLSDIESRLFSR